MGAVADITKYVKPKLEEAERRGKAEVALNLLKKGISIGIVSETTGLSLAEIKKLERR